MPISCLGFNTMTLFSRRIFKINDVPVIASFVLRRWFVQSLETLPWEIPKIFDWRANILNQSERLKKAPRPCRRFFKLLPPQSHSRFLCPRPPLLFSAPNQNRHATQAIDSQTSRRFAWAFAHLSTLQKLRTYDWLSFNPLGNNRPQRRSQKYL